MRKVARNLGYGFSVDEKTREESRMLDMHIGAAVFGSVRQETCTSWRFQ
jgi:hypothetical protein